MCSWAINGMIKSSVEHHKKFDYVESIFYELKKWRAALGVSPLIYVNIKMLSR